MSYSTNSKSGSAVFLFKSFLLDVFFGGYLAAIADRILYPNLIANVTSPDPTSVTFILYGTFAIIFAIVSAVFNFSQ